ncbi:hypothetical protein FHS85_001881 [Rhodoligotrophos appendicifer]|uniref:DUF4055 domain-containing protein n=1 Tax=Rhodoligotrophos appendicifer TaxID=987056 RepID=UPI001184E71C|nr:DUF4055 domain-containing protein [Rhodoligotrophos appendicifer]
MFLGTSAADRLGAGIYSPQFAHPDLSYWSPIWKSIRDAYLGEIEVKRKGTNYLPRLDNMTTSEYAAYLDRTAFYNMVARTANGMVGRLFQRPPKTEGVPSRLSLNDVTLNGQSVDALAREIAQEVVLTGRVGVMLDVDTERDSIGYFNVYSAENILDWRTERVGGKIQLTYVVLREIETNADRLQMQRYRTVYRVLSLDKEADGSRVYRSYLHRNENLGTEADEVSTALNRGTPLDYIPFKFFGPNNNDPGIDKPPILDIVTLNYAHYKASAHLEHGRFYTASPVYYVPVGPGSDSSSTSYTLGPSVVWEVDTESSPGILEFNGSGLMYLENSLKEKEAMVAALGGKLAGIQPAAASDSDASAKVKSAGEHSTLIGIAESIETGLTDLLQWWAHWQDVYDPSGITFTLTRAFGFDFDAAGAREWRAIHAMYSDKIITVEVLFEYLQRAAIVPDWMTLAEFSNALRDPASFPGLDLTQDRLAA